MHAFLTALRDACKTLETCQLNDCKILPFFKPCPMCLNAIYYARPKIIYYSITRQYAAVIGFTNYFIYEEVYITINNKKIPIFSLGNTKAKVIL